MSGFIAARNSSQQIPATLLNMDSLMTELNSFRRKARRLSIINELHGRLARAIDLPGMIEALSVWLLPHVPHELIAYNHPERRRQYLFCSCHGPKRREVMEIAANIFTSGQRSLTDHGDYAVRQWPLINGVTDNGTVLLLQREESLGLEQQELVSDALEILHEPLQRALDYEDLFEMANHDALTGLANRRVFEDRIDAMLDSAKRHGHPLSIASMDLDHFKQINDTLGHAEGDRVLQEVARVMRATIRSSDLLVRMGGDEFLLLLPETDEQAAHKLAERLCGAVDALELGDSGGNRLGVSIGLIQWQPELSRDALLLKADEALYQAKANGRSRVCVGMM